MATLQKIRNRAGVLIAIVIGLALVAFILGDLLSTGSAIFNRNQFELGTVKGKSISYQEFLEKYEELANIYRMNTGNTSLDEETTNFVRERTWQNMVDDMIMDDEYKELGLGVSPRELFEIIQGPNPHPIVQQMFTDPQTGTVSRSQLLGFWRSLSEDPTGERIALAQFIENSIYRERMGTKYSNLIKNGLYVTDAQAKKAYLENNRKVDLDYVVKSFQSIPDSLIDITEKDLKAYYKEHEQEYRQEETRDVEYVAFDIEPTDEDRQLSLADINELKKEFTQIPAPEVEQFVRLNSDEPYQSKNYVDGELPGVINDTMFMANEGEIYGPYEEDGSYKVAKLVAITYLPDSVKARHILIQPNQQRSFDQAMSIADSLKNLLENGQNFSVLARNFSDDQGSAPDGGDLGWFREGMMVKPFSDAAFTSDINEISLVETNYGIHLIQVTEKGNDVKKVNVAVIARNIEPSRNTINNVYREANEFGAKNRTHDDFQKTIEQEGFNKRIASNLHSNDQTISGLEKPRTLIQWAFKADEGDVSEIFELGDKYVIAAVSQVRPEGIAPMEQVLAEIQLNVMKEKKGQLIAEQFKAEDASSLDALAINMALDLKDAINITFASFSLPGAGVEPKVIATATTIEQNTISKPVIGTNGVYVLEVTNIVEPEISEQAISMEKTRLQQSYESRANFEPVNALREKANVSDKRIKFF